MIATAIVKWIMILSLTTPCGPASACSDSIAVSQTTYDSRELCLRAANIAITNLRVVAKSGQEMTTARAVCVQSTY